MRFDVVILLEVGDSTYLLDAFYTRIFKLTRTNLNQSISILNEILFEYAFRKEKLLRKLFIMFIFHFSVASKNSQRSISTSCEYSTSIRMSSARKTTPERADRH